MSMPQSEHFLSSKINIRKSTKICAIEFKTANFNSFCKQKLSTIPETFIEIRNFFGYTGNK